MANIKTALSMEEPLFAAVEALAEEMKVSRSRLFALAVREFLQNHKNQKLLEAINAAQDELADPGEEKLKTLMKSKYRRLMKKQW